MNPNFTFRLVAALVFSLAPSLFAHVPHDIIDSLGVSPDYAEDGLVFSSSTQFGESHLVSHNHGETFAESNTGMTRTLVTSHVFSPNFKRDGTVFLVTRIGYYKLTDRGSQWEKQSVLLNETILALVSKMPTNLDNFAKIEDFDSLTEVQRKEKAKLDEVLARFAREDVGGPHSFHEDLSMKLSESELEQMQSKAAKLKAHLENARGVDTVRLVMQQGMVVIVCQNLRIIISHKGTLS